MVRVPDLGVGCTELGSRNALASLAHSGVGLVDADFVVELEGLGRPKE